MKELISVCMCIFSLTDNRTSNREVQTIVL